VIVDWVLSNAKAYLGGQIAECSIAVEEGKIQKIGKHPQMPQADEKTDLHNQLVLPGLIDEHVHLRDQGKTYKEDFASGTAAAAAGGFTSVLDMPNNEPVTMSALTLQNRIGLAKRRILVNVGFYSEFPSATAEIKAIAAEGAVGFKLFMGSQIGGLNLDSDQAIRDALAEVAAQKMHVAVHAEDKTLLLANEHRLKQAKQTSPNDFLRAHTEEVEVKAVERILNLAKETEAQLHFCHVSTKEGLDIIAEAKKAGRKVTCEVTPNHLMLTSDDLKKYGGLAIMAPPVRSKANAEALCQGLESGTVDALGSDHAPHTLEEKTADNVWEVKVGLPGLEVTLPLMLTCVHKQKLSLQRLVAVLAEKPAEIWGLSDRGRLEAGKAADFTVVDFNAKWRIQAAKFKSKAKFSPYDGWEAWGKPVKTFVNGQLVYDEGEIVAKGGVGNVLRRGSP
jgi:dihydroorotase